MCFIKYGSESTIVQDALDVISEVTMKNCFGNNMMRMVLSALDENSNHLTQEFSKDVSRFFSPVNEEVWREVVEF